MRTTSILLLIILNVSGCTSTTEQQKPILADLNLYLKTYKEVDSVFISNITQDREYQFIPYSDTLSIEFNDSINDLYNLTFYTNGKKKMNQLWLNGENIIIQGQLTNRLEIDTVIGSDLYYTSIDFRGRYKQLLDNESDSATINEFLLNELKTNIDNPYSIEIATNFFYRNISRKEELKKVYLLQSNQIDEIKNHLFNSYSKIENILTVNNVNLTKFQFQDTNNQTVSLVLEEPKLYLIDFWFMACTPCIKDHRIIINKQEFLEANNVELIGLSTDRDQVKWSEYIEKENYYWKNLREIDEYQERLTTHLLITTFPTYLLLDGTGKILYRTNSFSGIEEHLNDESL